MTNSGIASTATVVGELKAPWIGGRFKPWVGFRADVFDTFNSQWNAIVLWGCPRFPFVSYFTHISDPIADIKETTGATQVSLL